ncbi:MAG: hypothetical protein WCG80_03105 [Spirochaetales bacterium]
MTAHLVRIGNSRGVRIPQKTLQLYGMAEGAELELEERQEGILIRLVVSAAKVSWSQAYEEMAEAVAERAEWSEWDALAGDGHAD